MPQTATKIYPYFPIFKNGTHKNKGAKKEWSADDVRNIFKATFDQGEEKIPFTIDHPVNNLPVFGWTDKNNIRLLDQGDKVVIEARPIDFSQDALEAIKATGRKKVSVALRSNDLSIRHIGLVEKPAVTDLEEIPFKEDDSLVFSEFEGDEPLFMDARTANYINSIGEILSGIRDYFIEMKGVKDTEPILGKWNVDWLLKAKPDEKQEAINSMFKLFEEGNKMPEEKKEISPEFQAELDAATKERDDLKAQLSAIAAEKRDLEFAAYLDGEKLKSKVTPAMKPAVLRLMRQLDGATEYEFSEEGNTMKRLPLDELKALLEGMPDSVEFGRREGQPSGDDDAALGKMFDEFNKGR